LLRNTLVLTAVLLILAIFALAGWANWEHRRQAAERLRTSEAKAELVPSDAGDSAEFHSPLVGKPAPLFSLEEMNGKKISLESYRGKAVLVNFWATWCGPCKIETPWLVELRDKYESQGFEILGVDTEGDDLKKSDVAGWAKDKGEIAKFVEQEKMPYPVLVDGDSISEPYGGLDALPTSFFVDRNGNVVAAQMGLTSESEIENNIRKSLGE
jgi:thiol-disulfide isomerase/thioredoxin